MKIAEEVVEMRHEAGQLDLFERGLISAHAYRPVSQMVIRGWHIVREFRGVVEWEIEKELE